MKAIEPKNKNSIAFGAQGIEPPRTSSTKVGLGTAYDSASCIWFTVSHGIINEVCFRHVDTPDTCDLKLLITNGETFCREERRDLLDKTEYLEQNALFFPLTNSDREGRYHLVKRIFADSHSSDLLRHARLEILDPKLRGKLRLYALFAPHIKDTGKNNSARWCGLDGRKLFDLQREDIDMSFSCTPDFTRRFVEYVGFSDGWQALMDNFKMDWEFEQAEDSNIALSGEIDLSDGMEFTVGVGFGVGCGTRSAAVIEAMEEFANEGGMLAGQLWDADDLPQRKMKRGSLTGSAKSLCWSDAAYVSLVRSHKNGVCFDRIEPIYQRYARAGTGGKIEIWKLAH